LDFRFLLGCGLDSTCASSLLSLSCSPSALSPPPSLSHALLPLGQKKLSKKPQRHQVKVTEPSADAQEPDASTSAPAAAAAAAAAAADSASAAPPAAKAARKPEARVPEGKAEIYIGFEKGDFAPREGRVGRVLVDDPDKYPRRDNDFVGGWAGGEVGLKAFAAGASAEASTSGSSSSSPSSAAAAAAAKAKKAGKVYIGHEKDDYEGRRLGIPGRFVDDDPQKYPDKEDIGPLLNAVGGFAGGERGVKAFAATGEIPLAPEGEGKRQFSPLAFAGFVALVGAGGGLLLNGVEEVAVEGGDSPEARALTGAAAELAREVAGVDGPQRAALTAAVAAVAAVAGILAVKAAVDGARARAAALGATVADGAKAAAFWVAVFFAFKLVIENS